MSFFATRGVCGDRARQGGPCRGWTPPPIVETWVRLPGDEELFGGPKAEVWRTQRQAKKFLEKHRRERKAGEGRGADDDEDAEAEDRDRNGEGVGDGGDQEDGLGAGEGAPGANRDEGMGVEVTGVEGEGVVGDGVVVGEGERGVSSGALVPHRPRRRSNLGRKRLTPCALAGTLTYNVCMFHLPFIHTFLFFIACLFRWSSGNLF